jgi:hypothetical protein
MGSGGGGGDNGLMMVMMMMQQQAQMEEQKRQAAAAALASSQRAENQNYTRYTDNIAAQNKKVSDQWNLYNSNIDAIKKLQPTYNAHERYTFNPYTVNGQYQRSSDQASADANTDLLNKWVSNLDSQAFNDYSQAQSQYNASKEWLAAAQAQKDQAGAADPGALPGTYGGGNSLVSGGAGAQPNTKSANTVGGAGKTDVYTGIAAGPSAASTAPGQGSSTGVDLAIGGPNSKAKQPSLADTFGNAVGGSSPKQTAWSIL